MYWIKQSTTGTFKIGPFLDEDDGKTAETALSLVQTDIRLSKNGGNMAQKNSTSSADLTHDELGYYDCEYDATDTGTLGRLKLMVHKSGALPVWHEFQVVSANAYDSLVGGSDELDVNVTKVGGTSQTANDNGADINAILEDTNELQSDDVPGLIATAELNIRGNDSGNDDTLKSLSDQIDGVVSDIAGQNDISSGDVETACGTALTTYDPPTKAEMDNAHAVTEQNIRGNDSGNDDTLKTLSDEMDNIVSDIAALNDLSQAEAEAACDSSLASYDPPTKAEMDAAHEMTEQNIRGQDSGNNDTLKTLSDQIDGLNDISTSDVDTALTDIHLDHLFATTYNPASKPGAADALLNELVEDDGGVARYTANALEEAPSAGTNPNVLVSTTLASVTSQTVFVLTAGSNDDNAYLDQAIALYDASDNDYPSVRKVTAYVGSTKTVTIDTAPDFTIIAGDGVKIFVTAPGTTAPTIGEIEDALAVTEQNIRGQDSGNDDTLKTLSDQVDGVVADIAGLNDVSSADVETACDASLVSYDPPTKAEMDNAHAITEQNIRGNDSGNDDTLKTLSDQMDAMNDVSSGDVETACGNALTTYDPPTKTEMDSGFAGQNDVSQAEVEAACDASLTAYDPPTKTELDTAESNIRGSDSDDLKTLSDQIDTVDGNVDAILDDTGSAGVVVAAGSKTGYGLASNGLDSISVTAPSGVASNFREMVVQIWRRWFKKATMTSTEMKTYADNGSTVLTTQTVSDAAGMETQNAAT